MRMRNIWLLSAVGVALVILFVFLSPKIFWAFALHPKHLRTFAHFAAVPVAAPAFLPSLIVAEGVEPPAAHTGSLGDRLALICSRLC